ncbi:SS18-like protein 2 [Astyanax mexicanus]|uniref:SS18-like protein 2 n=1 Tax=Astyanax mexicanus TaxID=7994 RepID=A0A8B9KFZ5_ASTMX|nr:SS18-like protein 2 [Astyanax mexicanus]
MSVVFVPKRLRGKAQINQETIQRLLDENDQLVRCIAEYMQKGRATECVQYQQILHRNLVYLGTIADASPDFPDSAVNSCEDVATANPNTEAPETPVTPVQPS